ncbi:MAG TPA: MarR family transcriptional regulator [Candidatus Acidoferrales bacterium]|nr:MarR family transcriptional regulator [Candidatus Acidoferrales bacterium]
MSSKQALVQLVDSRLRRATTAVDGLDQRAALIFGVNRTDLRLLDLLASQGPLTAGALARAAGISSGGMTIALDRLERAGYVRRELNPRDRRSIVVQVTEEIGRPSQEAFGPLQARVTTVLAGYRTAELEILAKFLESWGDAIEETLRS